MAKLVKSPPKYLPSEWHTSNRFNYSSAEKERAAAERLRAECERLRKETDATTARTQQDTAHKFSQRLRDVDFWKAELDRKLADNADETQLLLRRKEQLEQALVSTQFPLEVAQTCLGLREQRTSIDLVQDDVEIQLLKVCELWIICMHTLARGASLPRSRAGWLRQTTYMHELIFFFFARD